MEAVEIVFRNSPNLHIPTPYQDFSWLRSLYNYSCGQKGVYPFFVVVTSERKNVAILPLMRFKKMGCTICSWLGGSFQNINAGIFDLEWLRKIDEAEINFILNFIAEKHENIDLFYFDKQPPFIYGIRNVFCELSHKYDHPDPLYKGRMLENFNDWELEKRSRGSRNRLRRRLKALQSKCGNVEVFKAQTEHDVDWLLSAFLKQRQLAAKARFVPNPFQHEARLLVLSEAAKAALGNMDGLVVYALVANGEPAAINLSIRSGSMHAGFATSMSPAFYDFSPSKILQREVLAYEHQKGIREFDFGIGQEEYKNEWAEMHSLKISIHHTKKSGYVYSEIIKNIDNYKKIIKSNQSFYMIYKRLFRT